MGSFDLIKKLYFVRTSGTKEELKAANIIKDEVLALGIDDVIIESFDVDGCNITKQELKFYSPELDFECVGVGMSSSTSDEGVYGELVYVDSLMSAKMMDLEGKICIIHSKLVNYKIYEELISKKVAGLILATGSVYKDASEVDLDPYFYRERHYRLGKIPAVCIRMKDCEELVLRHPKFARIILKQDEFKNKSHNIIATIKGKSKENEIISFSAHYDSVSFSKGAYDNASGSSCILELLEYFKNNQPERTLKFIWCGSEESGLLGSKAYCSMHKDELNNYLLDVNVDMVGVTLGKDIAVCTSEENFVNFLKYDSKIKGFPLEVSQGVYSSDSTPFSDNGIPSVSFARISPTGGATIHSHDDVLDHLSIDNYNVTCSYLKEVLSSLINAKCFPISRNIPDKMKLELDYYLGRKERP